ncbi:hypothetical protein [Streptomyces sp. NPDC001809]
MSADTEERVEAVVDALGYRRRPARRRGSVVDLVLNELDSLWSVEIVRGVDEVLHAAGASMVHPHRPSGRSPPAVVQRRRLPGHHGTG